MLEPSKELIRKDGKFYREVEVYPYKDDQGKWIVKNFFKVDWFIIIMIICLLTAAVSYQHDMKSCFEIAKDPVKFCTEKKVCLLAQPVNEQPQFVISDVLTNNATTKQ